MSLMASIKKLLKPTKIKVVGLAALLILAGGIGASIYTKANASSGFDCDNNAVIRCGAPSMDSLKKAYSGDVQGVKSIYASFPFLMNSTSFSDFESNYVMGEVNSNNDVLVNGKVVATDAWTAGRIAMSGPNCTDQHADGPVFVRHPACSFAPSSPVLQAYIYMPNNQFRFAVLLSCGNPVVATPVKTPPKTPNYTITKEVSYQGKGWEHQVTAPVGGIVQYKVTVKSTGDAPVTHIFVNDDISANIQYVPNTLKINGNPAGNEAVKDFFSKAGLQIAGLNPGDSSEITFNAKVGVIYTEQNCKPGPYINNAFVNATQLPQKGANAYVEEKCTTHPNQTLVCDELSDTMGTPDAQGNTTFNFTAHATPTNVTITKYIFDFGFGGNTKTVTTLAHMANASFTYPFHSDDLTAKVTVYGSDGTSNTNDNCSVPIPANSSPTCTAPNGTVYPAGSPQCTPGSSTTSCTPSASTTCTTTTTLVNTGPGDVIGLFAGATGLGALGHWFYKVRKVKSEIR